MLQHVNISGGNMGPLLFSICHATARVPVGWRPSYEHWTAMCDDPLTVEYILSVHESDFVHIAPVVPVGVRLVDYANAMRKCSVDNWNNAAKHSTGKIIILNADDFFAPAHWDTLLLKGLFDVGKALTDEFAIRVAVGHPSHDNRPNKLMTLGIMSRALYERWGYALYPEYESMASDDDFTEHAFQDGVVIEMMHLTFEHRHHVFGKSREDNVYRHQNRQEAYTIGDRILAERRVRRFAS